MTSYFLMSVAVLALLLFFPARRMIWVLSVRRMQRRLGRELSAQEQHGQRARASFVALLLVVGFSWLFNTQLRGPSGG